MTEENFRRHVVEGIAKGYKVPYWIVGPDPAPSWLKRPVWRARALWWRWFT